MQCLTVNYADIYGHGKNMQKSKPYLAMVHNTPSTFTLLDRREHAWKKRILSQRLSEASIRQFEPAILELIDRFCEYLCPPSDLQDKDASSAVTANGWSEPFNMSTRCESSDDDCIARFQLTIDAR
jgi:hypothetical protein